VVWARMLLGAGIAALFVQSPTHAEVRIGVATPLTGGMAWFGEQQERGVAMAVAELNQAGGLLGEPIEVVLADDFCDAEQAVAAARKLVADDVVFVAGHLCSGAAIPASALYQEAGIIMIAPTATNPKLTEQGYSNVFRVVNRDTEQARLAGDYLAEQWADAKIAILHYGRGLAEETRGQLNQRSVKEAQFGEIVPGQPEYSEMVAALEEAGIEVLFYGGYIAEAALIARHAHDRDYDLQLLGSDNLNSEYFLRVAGPAAEGVRFVSMADPRLNDAARRWSTALGWPRHKLKTNEYSFSARLDCEQSIGQNGDAENVGRQR
jgi:branched-chain amino acid transport system substrate-binding protein